MKKKLKTVVIVMILVMLFVPVPSYLKDGGTVEYQAILWSVTKHHSMWTQNGVNGYLEGYKISVLWIEVYNDTEFVPCNYNE